MSENTSIGADRLLDSLTSIKLRDLALIKIQSQAVAEALRVLVDPNGQQRFLYRRAATLRAREVLAAFDAMPDVFGDPPPPAHSKSEGGVMVTEADLPPMPTEAEAWAARFKLRIIERLMVEKSPWTRQEAIHAAEAEYNGLDEPIDLTEDPVASADESMSYWDDDAHA